MNKEILAFDTLLIDDSNRLAVAVCKAVAANPGAYGKVLWIHGPTGCGKSHLLYATYRKLDDTLRGDVCYEPTEATARVLLYALNGEHLAWLRWQRCDVLLLDDVDSLCGRPAMQEEMLKLLLAKCGCGQQVVVVSTLPPTEFETLYDGLRGAECVMCANVTPPGPELRWQFAARYLEQHAFPITMQALTYLAVHSGTIVQLQGALHTAQFRVKVEGKKINVRWAKKYIIALTK